ncbi:MAG: carotenoid biosynthesis protein [Polyangia bacterium]
MPLPLFQTLCLIVIALTLVAMSRRRPLAQLLADYATLAVAAWLGEQTCITFYRFYRYADGWWLVLGDVPVLVPLIWPLVVLSARQVAEAVWPDVRAPLHRALLIGAIVTVDASLIEVLAVRAHLWRWSEAGHLGVPIIGMLGWGYFAVGTALCFGLRPGLRTLATWVLAPLCAHALILASWWGLFRRALRGPLGDASMQSVLALSALALVLVLRARGRDGVMPRSVALPRLVAASLFLSLLCTTARTDLRLWLHTLAVALPYLAATDLRRA